MSEYSDDEFLHDTMDEDDFEDDEESMEDSDLGDSEEMIGYSSIVNAKAPRSIYEVEFTVHSPKDVIALQCKEINHVLGILGIRQEHAATLLRHFRWNKERLIEKYMDDPEAVLQDAGVPANINSGKARIIVVPNFMCDICCNDDNGMKIVALACQHRFCKECYERYLTLKIKEEGESRRIQCMKDNCNVVMDEKTVETVVSRDVYERYRYLLNRTFVDDNPYLRWCPAPNCDYVVECHIPSTSLLTTVPTVMCKCGHRFCFGCGLADHQPCVCYIVKLWIKKCEDDSETSNWIAANTKECSKCHSTIEKNGGCNHMTCRKCKYEFCWVCMGPWSEHGNSWYNCNRYDEKTSIHARDLQAKSRAFLDRYLHYYNRYANHEQSAKLDRELFAKTERKMEEMQKTSELSWIEVQFLKKAATNLQTCRHLLKWTYAFAFYLESSSRNHDTKIFEDNQADLELAVERLSEMLEKPLEREKIVELRQDVTNQDVYVTKRKQIILEDTLQGVAENRWTFIVSPPN